MIGIPPWLRYAFDVMSGQAPPITRRGKTGIARQKRLARKARNRKR